jgi:hypothetical protein
MQVPARISRGLAILAGALLLLWPALLSGYPLLYPDSISYLADGRHIARILFLHAPANYLAMRSELYSLGIFPFHWNVTAWPVAALHALLTAWILWLAARSFAPRSSNPEPSNPRRLVTRFLLLTAFLSLTTSLAWYVSLIMPDILGPDLYLSIYLLVIAPQTLSTRERAGVAAIAAWAIAAHSTHLMLATGICLLLALLLLIRFPPMLACGRALTAFAALVLLVAGAQMVLHARLYGKPSLFGNHMPYLTARVVADGPGRWYLQQHCATLNWAICSRVADLPDNDDDFLWEPGGVWAGATPAQHLQMLQQEIPLVLGAVREYPRAQFQRSFANFWDEFTGFGLWDFYPNEWVEAELDQVLPGALPHYLLTRQARSALPTGFFTAIQNWVVAASALALAILLPFLWLRQRWQVLGLIAIVVPTVFANAIVTAVLSESDSRYQSRLIWLIPLTAALASAAVRKQPQIAES